MKRKTLWICGITFVIGFLIPAATAINKWYKDQYLGWDITVILPNGEIKTFDNCRFISSFQGLEFVDSTGVMHKFSRNIPFSMKKDKE